MLIMKLCLLKIMLKCYLFVLCALYCAVEIKKTTKERCDECKLDGHIHGIRHWKEEEASQDYRGC